MPSEREAAGAEEGPTGAVPKAKPRRTSRAGQSAGGSQVPDRVRGEIISTLQAEFSGPVPPPGMLAGYDKAISNGAERLFRQFELESEHRRSLERAKSRRLTLGLVFAAAFVIGGLAASVWLMAQNQAPWGVVTLIGVLATVAGVFIYGPQGRSMGATLNDHVRRNRGDRTRDEETDDR